MIDLIPAEELSVAALSRKEEAWINRLAKCLAACPPRLELLTAGDQLSVVDKDGARRSELSDGVANKDGVLLAYLRVGPICHGVS